MPLRRLTLLAAVILSLALSSPVWAGTLQFTGDSLNGQGLLSLNPTQNGGSGILSIAAGNGGNGALITAFLNDLGICAGSCGIAGGYLTLSTGTEASQTFFPGGVSYTFNAGGSLHIIGGVPTLGLANGSTLLTGTFMPGAGITIFGQSGSFQGGINLNSIVLNPAFGKFGYQSGHVNEFGFNIDGGACLTGGICTGTISQSTVQFTVPEPATLSVLGIGLFASGAGLRRKMAARLSA